MLTVAVAVGLVALGGRFVIADDPRGDDYAVRLTLPASPPDTPDRPIAVNRLALAPAIDQAEAESPTPDAEPSPTASAPRSKVPGMMALRYSLAGGAAAGDAIEVEKPVSIGGTDAGRIALRIDGNARVYALGSRLAAIIAAQSGEQAVPAGLGEDFVSLDALRALGIAVRYDATRDRLVLDPPAA